MTNSQAEPTGNIHLYRRDH